MKIGRKLLGQHIELEATINQWANDWITADTATRALVLSPLQVRLEGDEIETVRASQGDPNVGQFWDLWTLADDGTFSRAFPKSAAIDPFSGRLG